MIKHIAAATALGIGSAAAAAPYNRAIHPVDIHVSPSSSGAGALVSGRVRIDLDPEQPPRDLSFTLEVAINGVPVTVGGLPGAGGTTQRLYIGHGTPIPNPSNPNGPSWYNCDMFCYSYCYGNNGVCTWGVTPNFCQCATPGDFGPWIWTGRFALPVPPVNPGDVVTVDVRAIPSATGEFSPEILTSDDAAGIIAGSPCNRADITSIGGTSGEPLPPDQQLSVDDVIVFVNTFSDAVGCPTDPAPTAGLGPCSLADIADIGDSGAGPDGQLTVDDIIAFVNAFGDGC